MDCVCASIEELEFHNNFNQMEYFDTSGLTIIPLKVIRFSLRSVAARLDLCVLSTNKNDQCSVTAVIHGAYQAIVEFGMCLEDLLPKGSLWF